MIRTIGKKTFLLGQKKGNKEEKIAYLLKDGKWTVVYTGTFDGLKKFIDHQKKLSDKSDVRQMIADMCGTSYSAACSDMGISRI